MNDTKKEVSGDLCPEVCPACALMCNKDGSHQGKHRCGLGHAW
jgi:hypothetical protein